MASHETTTVSDERYMECLLGIDTKTGWEKSVTKVLSSFQDLSFDIDPSMGLAHVKGKIDPHIVLKKLMKGGKHAKIHWLTYGPQRDHHQFSGHIQVHRPYVPNPQFGHTYNNYDHPYHLYGNYYNPCHNHNSTGHFLPINAPPLQQHHHHDSAPSRCRERRSSAHLHQHNSPVPSSSTSSSRGRVSEPVVKRRAAAFINGLEFIKEVVSIKKVTKKFQSCFGLGFGKKINNKK